MTENPYNTTDGIIERLRELDNPETAAMFERLRDRVAQTDRDDGGYYLKNPPESAPEREWFVTVAVLFGAALEREYPATVPDEQ